MSLPRKTIIEQFAEAVSSSSIKNLDQFLDNDVKKTVNSKVVYTNLQEAEKYYTAEEDGKSTSRWAIVECDPENPDSNTFGARILHDNKTSNTTYTFNSSGKIQQIDVIN
jgi:hypothetical protein